MSISVKESTIITISLNYTHKLELSRVEAEELYESLGRVLGKTQCVVYDVNPPSNFWCGPYIMPEVKSGS